MGVLTKSELRRVFESAFAAPLTQQQIEDLLDFASERVRVKDLPQLVWILSAEDFEVPERDVLR